MGKREQHIALIRAAETEYKNAGPIHKKDLRRYISRLKKELQEYDKWHKKAAR